MKAKYRLKNGHIACKIRLQYVISTDDIIRAVDEMMLAGDAEINRKSVARFIKNQISRNGFNSWEIDYSPSDSWDFAVFSAANLFPDFFPDSIYDREKGELKSNENT